MSLVQQLRGDLGQALAELCPNARDAAAEVGALGGSVVKPTRRMPMDHYAAVGSIVGQRLADAIEPAPPYPALLGAIRCCALRASEAGLFACGYPTHQVWPMEAEESRSGVFIRPTPSGWWLYDGVPADDDAGEPGIRRVLADHCDTAARSRIGELGSAASEYERLPALRLLQQLEDIYRGAADLAGLQAVADTGSVPVPPEIADDVLRVLDSNRATLRQVTNLSTGRHAGLGHAAPLFVPHWAEGDVLVGPHPYSGRYTLLDIKTVTQPDVGRAAEWILQIIAYALLDVTDRWRIDRVGLWLPRQARLVGWPLADLVGDVEQLRQRWLPLARRAAHSDGADAAVLFPAPT